MTEADWWAATDPNALFSWIGRSFGDPAITDDRLAALVACGYCSRTEPGGPPFYRFAAAQAGADRMRQIHVIHDILGPMPFRDVSASPAWLTADVLALARGIYDEKAFDRLPILADALQDAGCDCDELLNHLRVADWEHVRGCWALDLVLGRPWREPPT